MRETDRQRDRDRRVEGMVEEIRCLCDVVY